MTVNSQTKIAAVTARFELSEVQAAPTRTGRSARRSWTRLAALRFLAMRRIGWARGGQRKDIMADKWRLPCPLQKRQAFWHLKTFIVHGRWSVEYQWSNLSRRFSATTARTRKTVGMGSLQISLPTIFKLLCATILEHFPFRSQCGNEQLNYPPSCGFAHVDDMKFFYELPRCASSACYLKK